MSENKTVISVIIPVYKAEQFLANAVENILKQPFSDIELLLIDDGNTDNSGVICDNLALNNPRIKVFHEKHSGVSHSRQVGVDNAQGEYLMFIDADDFMEKDMLTEMYSTAKTNNAEMVICDYNEITQNGITYKKQNPSDLDGIPIFNDILRGNLYGALWNKMIRTSVVRSCKAKFDERLTMREDLLFLSQLLPFIHKVSYIPKALYSYNRQNENSLTYNYFDVPFLCYQQDVLSCSLLLQNKHIMRDVRLAKLNYFLELAYITLRPDLFSLEEWKERFVPYKEELMGIEKGYKAWVVRQALKGNISLMRKFRFLMSKIR